LEPETEKERRDEATPMKMSEREEKAEDERTKTRG
jgi:hypothetical protein